jgi:RNA polymerase sigma-70 factor (ECF subfamily)
MPDPTKSPFARLADRELDRAYRLAGLLLGNQVEAEDATQDALLRAWSAAASLRNPDDFQGWFDRILVNVCRDRLRRRRLVQFVPIDDASENRPTADPFASVLADDELARAIAGLDEDLRTAVVLRFWADLTVDEIARRTGTRPGTIKSRLNRAMGLMRDQLAPRAAHEDTR